jgi:hypothetical protein
MYKSRMMLRTVTLCFSIAGALIMGLIWTVGQTGLSETNAHLCELFGQYFSISENCQASDVIVTIAGYLCLFAVTVALLDLAWIISKKTAPKTPVSITDAPSLEIIFDRQNLHKRFWSLEPEMEAPGKPTGRQCWEYRIKVRNSSTTKTIRNVRAEVELAGELPSMPTDLSFKKDGGPVRDLQPAHAEFVPFCWIRRPQAGDAWGETARRFYSPMIITVRGDDVLPKSISFSYHPDDIPALVEIP